MIYNTQSAEMAKMTANAFCARLDLKMYTTDGVPLDTYARAVFTLVGAEAMFTCVLMFCMTSVKHKRR